jgi:hypothetical protein
MAVGDFNGDGAADLTVILSAQYNSTSGTVLPVSVLILAGNGVGGFTSSTTSAASGYRWGMLMPASINADGVTDLVLAESGVAVQPFLGQSKMSTAAVKSIAVTGAGPHKVAVSYSGNSAYGAAPRSRPNSPSNNHKPEKPRRA